MRIATSETLSATFLATELVALHAAHPGIEVQLVTGTTSLNLLRREADVALRVGQRPTHQSRPPCSSIHFTLASSRNSDVSAGVL